MKKTIEEVRDWLIENRTNEKNGVIDLSELNFGNRVVVLSKMKAKEIYQGKHVAKEIYQTDHKATQIYQDWHKAETIYQSEHTAEKIYQDNHEAEVIIQNTIKEDENE